MPSRSAWSSRSPRRRIAACPCAAAWVLALALALPSMAGCRHAGAGTSLRITVPQEDLDADLYVDGQYVGQVGAMGKQPVGPVQLAPGVHRVEVRKPGRFPVQRTVRVDAATPAETVIEAELLEDPQ